MMRTTLTNGGESLYFGYGSNLDEQDWARFCRRHRFDPACLMPVGPAWLPDQELVFDYHSPSRGGGALNLRPRLGQAVEGFLFRVSPEGWRALDRKEGAPSYYERVSTTALLPDGREVPVVTYRARADRVTSFQQPAAEYLEICRRGRQRFRLGTRMLEAVAEGQEAELEVLGMFAYGSLMRAESRFSVVEQCGLKCALLAQAWGDLYDCGQWPAMSLRQRPEEWQRVTGELLIPRDLPGLLERLDPIEGFCGFGQEARLFRRTLIDVDVDSGRLRRAWVFVMEPPRDAMDLIPSGDWRKHRQMHTRFMRALVAAHAEGVEEFETRVAMELTSPACEFDPEKHSLTMSQLVESVLCGDIAERRLARVSERWAAVPVVNGISQGAMQ